MQKPLSNTVHLNDIIRIGLPLSTTVIGQAEQIRRNVNWVAVLTSVAKLSEQVQSNDVVILPLELQKSLSPAELLAFLKELNESNVSGLILFTPLNKKGQTLAEKLGIVLMMVGDDVSVREVHRNIAALLLDHQTQISERGMQLYRELSEMSREGAKLGQMAQLIGKLTGKIVVIQDKRLEIRAIDRPTGSLPIETDRLYAALTEKDNLPAVLRNRKAAAKAKRSHWQQLLFPNHNVARLISPVISGDRARGYLSLIGPAGELDMLDAVAIEQGAAACALDMAKAKAVNEARKALRGDFLEGVLAGTIPEKEIERLATRLEHKTDRPHMIISLKWIGDPDASLRRIETTINWLLTSSKKRKELVHVYSEDHICVFQALRDSEQVGAPQDLDRRLRSQLKIEYPDGRLYAGMSGPALTLSDWPRVHQESLQALNVAQRLNLDEIVDYGTLGVYRLLSQLDDNPAVHSFCDQVIGSLVAYDSQHRSNLVQTTEEYFDHHGNVSQTAEALFIHRNTLLYRLERIQELTGHDLDQSDMRLALHLALKLWKLRPET